MGVFDSFFGGGSGGYDTSAMAEATREANALNKQIYEEGKEYAEPFYQGGLSAFQRLMDLLGLQGGSNKTRDQIFDQLKPQYTTQPAKPAYEPITAADLVRRGRFALSEDQLSTLKAMRPDLYDNVYNAVRTGDFGKTAQGVNDFFGAYGGMGGQEAVDYNALNAAVDAQFSGQGTPSDYGYLTETFGAADFEKDPGYQFRLDEGEKAISRALAARGKSFAPEAVKALSGYNSGMASQEFNTAFDRDNINKTNLFNRLATLSGYGPTATSQVTQGGQNYATNTSNNLLGLANAQTAAQVAKASRPSMFSQLLGAGAQLGSAYLMGGV